MDGQIRKPKVEIRSQPETRNPKNKVGHVSTLERRRFNRRSATGLIFTSQPWDESHGYRHGIAPRWERERTLLKLNNEPSAASCACAWLVLFDVTDIQAGGSGLERRMNSSVSIRRT